MPVLAYPSDVESDIILRDGTTVRLRPVREADAAAALAFFEQLSERSLYYRFMMIPHLDLVEARRIVTIDYEDRMVLLAERGDVVMGLAGYYRDPERPERAEVAFAVADALQGHGLGTRMLERLAEVGRERGVSAFDAFVLGENLAMMDVFLQSGFTLTRGLEQGVFHVAMDLAPFERINPCGHAGLKTVDLSTIGVRATWDEVASTLGVKLANQLSPR